jgi:hypothetical protein
MDSLPLQQMTPLHSQKHKLRTREESALVCAIKSTSLVGCDA